MEDLYDLNGSTYIQGSIYYQVIGKRLVSNVMPESVKSVKEKERKKLKDKELWFL